MKAVGVGPAARSKRRPRSREWREWLAAYAFLAPQLIGLVVFVGGPLIVSLYYTFTHWDLVAPAPTWVGLSNWQYFFQDPRIVAVVLNTIKFILWGTTSFLLLSLVMALILNRQGRGVGLLRAAFFLPWVLSPIAVGVTWKWMFNTQSGPIALGFGAVGAQSPDWLLDPRFAMIAIAIMTTWQGIGYGMTIYLAGLQGVPGHLYEAAKIDGATAWARLRYITLPLLSPTILFLTITSFIGAFQLFDPVVAMTGGGGSGTGGAGGPDNSTRTIVLYLYNQMFEYSEVHSGIGYASVIAWMLVVLILAVTLVQWGAARRWVFYGGAEER
jgi:multiple sugar transport system permease protein